MQVNNRRPRKRFVPFFLAAAMVLPAFLTMANSDFDQEKIAACVACHGADGLGKADQYPDLQGKPVEYLFMQLKYFKSGARKSSAMNTIAKPLAEEDMRMLAVFFNQVK